MVSQIQDQYVQFLVKTFLFSDFRVRANLGGWLGLTVHIIIHSVRLTENVIYRIFYHSI
jgi:hypothetical protein